MVVVVSGGGSSATVVVVVSDGAVSVSAEATVGMDNVAAIAATTANNEMRRERGEFMGGLSQGWTASATITRPMVSVTTGLCQEAHADSIAEPVGDLSRVVEGVRAEVERCCREHRTEDTEVLGFEFSEGLVPHHTHGERRGSVLSLESLKVVADPVRGSENGFPGPTADA